MSDTPLGPTCKHGYVQPICEICAEVLPLEYELATAKDRILYHESERDNLLLAIDNTDEELTEAMWYLGIERDDMDRYTWPFHGVRYTTLSEAVRTRLKDWSGLRATAAKDRDE